MFKKVGDLRQFFREKFVLKKEDEKNKKCLQGCCSYHDGLNDSRTACEDGFVPERLGGVTVKKDLVAFNLSDLGKGISKATSVITDKTIEAGGFVKDKAVEVGSFVKDKAVEGIEKTVELINQGMELIETGVDIGVQKVKEATKEVEDSLKEFKNNIVKNYKDFMETVDYIESLSKEAALIFIDVFEEDIMEAGILYVQDKMILNPPEKWAMRKILKKQSESLLRGNGYNEAADLWEHSLQGDPCNLYFHQDDSLSKKIMKSKEYNDFIRKILGKAETKNLSYFSFDTKSDNKICDANEVQLVYSEDRNLMQALHGLSGGVQIEGAKDLFNNWHLEVKISDEFDFDYKDENNLEPGVDLKSAKRNNFAVAMEDYGVINPYWVYIDFKEVRGDFIEV